MEEDLQIPLAEEDGKIPTLNQTGYMSPGQNPYNLNFINFAATCPHPILEIGAAYGLTILPALRTGAQVIANDIDARHLLLLRERTEENLRVRLTLNNKKFPAQTEFPNHSIGAILLCRVMHFFKEDEIEQAITKMTKWLVPGGRIFIITMSPYHSLFQEILPAYIQKVKGNVPWPGMIHNMHQLAPHLKHHIPNFLHVMEHGTLGKFFEQRGFKIVEDSFFDYPHPKAEKSDGKGYYGVILEKKI